jgi:hypothetical protein
VDNETAILRRISHPNIVQLIEEYESAKEIFLVLELVQVWCIISSHKLKLHVTCRHNWT